jgi:hypothetical protein
MNNKKVYIAIGIVAVVLVLFLASRPKNPITPPSSSEETGNTQNTPGTSSKTSQTTKTTQSKTTVKTASVTTNENFPDMDFIDKRLVFSLKDFPNVKVTVERVAFGRGDAAISTGCTGVPNADFSAYLYPGSGICLGSDKVDGSPRGIVAFHMLIQNNSSVGFGGNSDVLRLQYLRSDSTGKPVYRFAYPLSGLTSYYIEGYSSKEVILSYLVPEDQLVFNLVSGYKEPTLENKTLNVYDFSTNGILIDFSSKTLKIVK